MSTGEETLARLQALCEEALQGRVIGSVDMQATMDATRQQVAEVYGCEPGEIEVEVVGHVLHFRLPPMRERITITLVNSDR